MRTLLEYAKRLLTFVETAEKNKEEIRELRRDFVDMALEMERLRQELVRFRNEERLEREKQRLQLENAFLRLERRLNTPRDERDTR